MTEHLKGAPPSVWDPLVRLSHWGIATVVLLNGLFTDGGGVVHVWLGWTALVLLVARLFWGLVGTAEARFASFPPSPSAAVGHLRAVLRGRPPEYRSHNPAGAMMIYALWGLLLLVVGTGLYMTGGAMPWQISSNPQFAEGHFHGGWLIPLVHVYAADLILVLSGIHLGGVIAESLSLRRNLVRPMIHGQRGRANTPGE
ncbi:hypothetical protein U879_17140 [Defluviimonas sp. 20V17]|uniref:Cytochrome b n=1 Tax=Allgaiera indica TaxID=765699 RepID=A0AAN5A0D4_9RHOB|nr:cytochrome b/b6 domain-containing protein [Allgaiera indica]KDB02452.1 hypothetical protein U879_17140 [Defluviimonas sp. 20V17]GHE02019.1 hypothetical protein GCM10008024_19950 [Allgaiera indica]SDX03524.1 Cytochrome b [Allgaiera indica]